MTAMNTQLMVSGWGGAAVRSGLASRISMTNAALAFALLLPVSAVAQTPADLARLAGGLSVVEGGISRAPHGVVADGGTARDLARLIDVAPSSGSVQTAAPASAGAFSAGAFAAGDLARLNAAGSAWWRVAPDFSVAAKQ
jgi:hypothetical protein